MNKGFTQVGIDLEQGVIAKFREKFVELQKNDPTNFGREAFIKLEVENDFDEEKTIKQILKLVIENIRNEIFK